MSFTKKSVQHRQKPQHKYVIKLVGNTRKDNMTTRNTDMKKEALVQRWLDENYYTPTLSALHWERCMDKERQFKGADIVVEVQCGVSAFIDEKTKLYPMNTELPCLCHEAS